jgi:cell division protein FtsW (lipid II flippase)
MERNLSARIVSRVLRLSCDIGEKPGSIAMMRLLTAHRILIIAAVVFFVFFAFWEYRNFRQTDNVWAVLRAALYLLVAVGFGVYFKKLKRWYK